MELETIKFIKHFKEEDLKNGKWKYVLFAAPYFLNIKEDEHYYLLKYDQFNSDFTNEIVKECRGLIIDKETFEPVALSFKKFWEVEVEELADDIDWVSAKVQEKVDGSKILCFYNKYENRWQLATSGNLNAYEAKVNDFGITFGDLFNKALQNNNEDWESFTLKLHTDYCYTFELVAPENRIVVEYNEADLYFIGCRNCKTFEEINPKGYHYLNNIKSPKEYSLRTLEDCLKATKKMTYNEEGYVVVDKNWHRIKIKSPAWKIASHMRFNEISKTRFLEIIEANRVDEILKLYPEYKDYFNNLLSKRHHFINSLIKAYRELREFSNSKKDLTQKDYAIWIMGNYKSISNFLFNCVKIGLENEYDLYKWWEELPTNKKLRYLENV